MSIRVGRWNIGVALWRMQTCNNYLWCYHVEGEPGLEMRELALRLTPSLTLFFYWDEVRP